MGEPSFWKSWKASIWESSLSSSARFIAMQFLDFMGADGAVVGRYGPNSSWVANEELTRRTGYASPSTLSSARQALTEGGWLREVEPSRQHRTPVYVLELPQASDERMSEESETFTNRTPEVSSPSFGEHSPSYGRPQTSTMRMQPLKNLGSTSPRPPPQLAVTIADALIEGEDLDGMIQAVWAAALVDPTTEFSPEARLAKVPSYANQLIGQVREAAKVERRAGLDAQERCPDCGKPDSECKQSNLKVLPNDRCRRLEPVQ